MVNRVVWSGGMYRSRVLPNDGSWPRALVRPGQELTSAVASLADGRADVSAETRLVVRFTSHSCLSIGDRLKVSR